MLQIHIVEAITLVESTLIDLFSLSSYRRCSFQSKYQDLTSIHKICYQTNFQKKSVIPIDIELLEMRNSLFNNSKNNCIQIISQI